MPESVQLITPYCILLLVKIICANFRTLSISFTLIFLSHFVLIQKSNAQSGNAGKPPYNLYKGDTINRKDAKGLRQGVWMRFYKSDSIFYKGQFKDDKPYGLFTYYHENGKIESQLTWDTHGDKARGVHYYEDGKIKARGNYVGQQKDSTWLMYHNNDSLMAIETYKAGRKQGMQQIFYKNGKMASSQLYSNDAKDGPFREFYPDGKKKTECSYKNNKMEGYFKSYYINGFVHLEGPYKNNKKNGLWKLHKDDGSVIANDIFVDGVCPDNNIEKILEAE